MSYNIRNVKTISSNLTMTARSAKIILRDFDLPECSFMEDIDVNDPDLLPTDIFEIKKLTWTYTGSGTFFSELKTILRDHCQGEGKFIIVWEDGEYSGLKVEGEGVARRVLEPKVKLELDE